MAKTSRECPSCGARLYGPFCSECGGAADRPTAAPTRIPLAYVIGGGSIVALLGALVVTQTSRSTTVPAPSVAPVQTAAPPVALSVPGSTGLASTPEGTPPDLSTMTPAERFDRLFDRVMRASEGGDTATVTTFAPMALAAYGMLDARDADARFHAGLIHIATGDLASARTLADAITAERPGHLFGILLRGRIAEVTQNQSALAAAHREFRAAYAAEAAAQRPEYTGHQTIIDRFLKDATP